jgi:hypothetical protein
LPGGVDPAGVEILGFPDAKPYDIHAGENRPINGIVDSVNELQADIVFESFRKTELPGSADFFWNRGQPR